ncbi:putative 2OG-Fe(II) oxygenase [Aureococcus anophagefferens]|nr:putative 2OG-Fe(II) oxygenase [Aureococcus anophagefferens]
MAPEGEVLGDPAMLLPLVLMWYGGAGLVGAVGVLLIKVVDSMDPPQQWHASTDAAKDAADDEALARADALEDHHGSEPGERDAAAARWSPSCSSALLASSTPGRPWPSPRRPRPRTPRATRPASARPPRRASRRGPAPAQGAARARARVLRRPAGKHGLRKVRSANSLLVAASLSVPL